MTTPKAAYYGRAIFLDAQSSAVTPNFRAYRVYAIVPAVASLIVNLPQPSTIVRKGFPVGILLNRNPGTDVLDVRTHTGAALVTVSAGQAALLALTEEGTWHYVLKSTAVASGGGSNDYLVYAGARTGFNGATRTEVNRWDEPLATWSVGADFGANMQDGAGTRLLNRGYFKVGTPSGLHQYYLGTTDSWTTVTGTAVNDQNCAGVEVLGENIIYRHEDSSGAKPHEYDATLDSWTTLADWGDGDNVGHSTGEGLSGIGYVLAVGTGTPVTTYLYAEHARSLDSYTQRPSPVGVGLRNNAGFLLGSVFHTMAGFIEAGGGDTDRHFVWDTALGGPWSEKTAYTNKTTAVSGAAAFGLGFGMGGDDSSFSKVGHKWDDGLQVWVQLAGTPTNHMNDHNLLVTVPKT